MADSERSIKPNAAGGAMDFKVVVGNGLIGKWEYELVSNKNSLVSGSGWSDKGEDSFNLDPAVAVAGTELTIKTRIVAPAADATYSLKVKSSQDGKNLLKENPVALSGSIKANKGKYLSVHITIS